MDLYESLRPSMLESIISGLNGVSGESFRDSGSAWAVKMGFYFQNKRLPLDKTDLEQLRPRPGPRVAVFIHGLGSHEQLWSFPKAYNASAGCSSYGSLLLDEFAFTPLYLRYNSGLRISENGQALSSLLAYLVGVYPVAIEQIVLVGHSLGGLLIRSACHYGADARQDWVAKVRKVFYLGAPHFGLPWENSTTDGLLGRMALSEHPLARKLARIYRARGPAIEDLRYPHLVEEDWKSGVKNKVTAIPWPTHYSHYFITGTITRNQEHPVALLMGDGMVPLSSAQGIAHATRQTAEYAHIKRYSAVIPGISHLRLANTPRVYSFIKRWMEEEHEPGHLTA